MRGAKIIQVEIRVVFLSLKNRMLATDCGVIDCYVTKIIEATDQIKAFRPNFELAEKIAVFDNFETALIYAY